MLRVYITLTYTTAQMTFLYKNPSHVGCNTSTEIPMQTMLRVHLTSPLLVVCMVATENLSALVLPKVLYSYSMISHHAEKFIAELRWWCSTHDFYTWVNNQTTITSKTSVDSYCLCQPTSSHVSAIGKLLVRWNVPHVLC